jgi:hypothetical protein
MTKTERQVREVEAALDGETLLTPLEKVYLKIGHFRRRKDGGVTVHLSAKEADALEDALQAMPDLDPYSRFEYKSPEELVKEVQREAREWGVRQEKQ